MNEPKWKNESGDSKIERAERAVSGSLDRLESAMEVLTEKVEDSSQKIRHVLDMGTRQKDEILRLKSQATSTLMPVLERGRTFGAGVVSQVRADPRPFLFGALAVVGGLLLLTLRARRAKAYSHGPEKSGTYESYSKSFSIEEPDTWAA